MKNLLFKRNLTLLLCSVFVMMFVFSSCGKDDVSNVSNSDVQEEQVGELEIPEGSLKTTLDLRDQESIDSRDENGQSAGAVIELSTNNEEIFAYLNKENFKTNLITEQQQESFEDRNVEDVDGEIDESLRNSTEHFVTIKILSENVKEGEAINYTLSDDLLKVLKKYKAGTFIHFSTENDDALVDRYGVYRNTLAAYGDGGSIPTKLRLFYDFNCSWATPSSWTTGSGFYNSYTFKSCQYPWYNSSRKRYRYFYVTQDVLRSFSIWNSSSCYRCY